jgi:hypothetical protein
MHYEAIEKIIVVWRTPPWKINSHRRDNRKTGTTRSMDST